jgi:hypothetical protein
MGLYGNKQSFIDEITSGDTKRHPPGMTGKTQSVIYLPPSKCWRILGLVDHAALNQGSVVPAAMFPLTLVFKVKSA